MKYIQRIKGQKKGRIVSYRATIKQHEALYEEAAKRDITMAHVIELGLRKLIKDYP